MLVSYLTFYNTVEKTLLVVGFFFPLTRLFSSFSPQITQLDPAWTLLEAKLFPQETLFLEAKE